jgi:hypothetical protein
MPVTIAGRTYFSNAEVADDLKITRQTLWRWRDAGKIPPGLRSRSRQVLFAEEEVAVIRDYANRLEPIEFGTPQQMRLFKPQKAPENP